MPRIALLLAFLPFAAHAHLPTSLEKIEVEGHYENGLGTSDAASQGTVTGKLIENRPTLRPAEILEFVPGVIVTQHSGGGKANQYFLRGFNLDHGTDFATSVGGMPVNMPTHAHGQGYSDLNFLIPELVGRIDYVKGPYFAPVGDFGSAGAARLGLLSRLASDVASLTVGGNGYRRVLAMGSREAAGGNLLAAAELVESDGPWTNPEDLRRANAVLRYSHGSTERGWSLTGMTSSGRWNATDQIPQRAVDAGLLGRFDAVDPGDGGRSRRHSLTFDARQPFAGGRLEANAYAIRSRLDLFSNFTYFLDEPVRGDQFAQAERRTTWGGELQWRLPQAGLGLDMTHTLGAQLRADRLDPVGLYRTAAREVLDTIREDRVRQRSGAVFYENAAHWNERLRTLLGVRHDRYDFRVAGGDGIEGRARDAITSPKASLIVGPIGVGELFLNWGRGFHSNDARGVAGADRATPLVRSTGAELGVRIVPLAGLQSSLSLWRLDLASELLFVGDAGTTEASRPSRRHGVEWSTHYAAGESVLFDLDVAVSRARFRGDDPAGDRIPGAPDRVIGAGVTLDAGGPWSASLQVRHFGPRPLVGDGAVRSHGTTLLSGRLGWRLSERWGLRLDGFNLLDRKASDIDYFYASRLRGEPASGIEDVHFHPVEPRSFRLTLTARF